MPALLNSAWMRSVPCCSTSSSRNRCTAASSDTSATWVVTFTTDGASLVARSSVSAIVSPLTSHVATEQPSLASWTTSSRPIPVPPPVTTASRPSNESTAAPSCCSVRRATTHPVRGSIAGPPDRHRTGTREPLGRRPHHVPRRHVHRRWHRGSHPRDRGDRPAAAARRRLGAAPRGPGPRGTGGHWHKPPRSLQDLLLAHDGPTARRPRRPAAQEHQGRQKAERAGGH